MLYWAYLVFFSTYIFSVVPSSSVMSASSPTADLMKHGPSLIYISAGDPEHVGPTDKPHLHNSGPLIHQDMRWQRVSGLGQ